ncbi:MAG TPA: (Fe-S)-binding protein [Bacillota bacterium]
MSLKTIYEEVAKCNRCGGCQAVCPTYAETRVEWSVARGRIALVRAMIEGKLPVGPETLAPIYECLLCQKCVAACPSGVRTDQIMLAAREELMKTQGKPAVARAVVRILRNPRHFNTVVTLLGYYTKTLRPVTIVTRLERVAGIVAKANRLVERTERRSLQSQSPRYLKVVDGPAHKVAYFIGCATNRLNHAPGIATIDVLQRNRVRVEVPEAVCCGLPALAYGDTETAKEMARRNLDRFAGLDVEAVVSDCGSCTSTLAEYAELLADDPDYRAKARALSMKVRDISKYLVEIGFAKPRGEVKTSVTYHDPCHLCRHLKVTAEPRAVLKSIPGLDFREMKEADACCGAAGSYMLTHVQLSDEILGRKVAHVAETKAEILATGCPACQLNLGYGLKKHGVPAKVVHAVELLAQAYRSEEGAGTGPATGEAEDGRTTGVRTTNAPKKQEAAGSDR